MVDKFITPREQCSTALCLKKIKSVKKSQEKISLFLYDFYIFSTGQVWNNWQVYKLHLLEHEWIRTGIIKFEAQIEEKNNNIEARQNVTGSYKKRVYYIYSGFVFLNCILIKFVLMTVSQNMAVSSKFNKSPKDFSILQLYRIVQLQLKPDKH